MEQEEFIQKIQQHGSTLEDVITKDIVQPHYDEYGILTINIYDFLLDPHCIEK